MNFKVIKSLDDKSFRNLYEMSEDGKHVRKVEGGEEISILPGTTVKCELGDASGKKKAFGIKSLYWASWNKPLPADAVKGLEIKATIKPQRGKKVESTLIVKTGALLSKHMLQQINDAVIRRELISRDASGLEFTDGKAQSVRSVLHNLELKQMIVRVDSQSWRNGYWFLDLKTGNHIAFEDSKHRKNGELGDHNILWPGFQS